MQAPRGRQLKIHGNIVNVPADVTHTVNILPRLQNQTATIKVNLKRMLKYKSSALSLNQKVTALPIQNTEGKLQEGPHSALTMFCNRFEFA